MPIRHTLLLAVAAAMAAGPALAQGGPPPDAPESLGPAYDDATAAAARYDAPADGYVYEADAGADYAQGDDAPPPPHAYRGDYGDPRAMMAPGALPPQPMGPPPAGPRLGYTPEQRAGWLHECRARYGRDNDGGLGGAVIGGVVGGVIGNRAAGRHHRTEGTVIGAGVGAVAGAAIDRAEDRGRAKDECEDYLDRYEAYYAGSGGYGYGAGYAYGQNVIYVPMIVGWDCKPKRRVVEEYVEPAPAPARRVIYAKPAPTKVIRTTKPIKAAPPVKQIKSTK